MTTTPPTVVPRPIAVGPEMARLDRFFPDVTWTGTIHENGMGPGSPAMDGRGSGTHRRIQGGRWIVGDYTQDQFLTDGTYVLTWELHWVVGWDPASAQYRATLNDNYGHADVMRGRVDGDRLVFESTAAAGVRLRLTWDASVPSVITWTNEATVGDGPWMLVESYRMVPLAA